MVLFPCLSFILPQNPASSSSFSLPRLVFSLCQPSIRNNFPACMQVLFRRCAALLTAPAILAMLPQRTSPEYSLHSRTLANNLSGWHQTHFQVTFYPSILWRRTSLSPLNSIKNARTIPSAYSLPGLTQ